MRRHNPYACFECGGEGFMECPCCESEVECESCDGCGLNDSLLDVAAFKDAESKILAAQGATWEWREGDTVLGRMADGGVKLAYADFKKGKT